MLPSSQDLRPVDHPSGDSYYSGFEIHRIARPVETAQTMTQHRIYRITSIGRPLDPSYPTNKAVFLLMPVAAVIAGTVTGLGGADAAEIAIAALTAVAVVFGSWALARELAPDDNAFAFVSMAFAFVTALFVDSSSLLLLFTTLFLVRIVNRSVGLPARVTDCLAVALLAVWAVYSTDSPLLGVVAALAFVFDALLRAGQRHQWMFAALCLAGAGGAVWHQGGALQEMAPLDPTFKWLIAVVTVAYAATILSTRRVESTGDATGTPLSVSRVRAGMWIGLLVALQALINGTSGFIGSTLVWATLAGIALGGVKRLFRGRQMG